MLRIENITKSFAGTPPVVALKGVSLSLDSGGFAALVGPSGSGKTTLLNLASGLDRPSTGSIWIGDQEISSLSEKELTEFRSRRLGFVFQAFNLFPILSAVENVEYTCRIRGDSPKESRAIALEALRAVGLGDKVRSRPNELSGGQQQRVAVARALATRPEIIFADEPTANLDSRTAHELIDLFESLNREKGVTFLFSTHDTKIIDRVRTVVRIADGQLSS